MSFEGYYQIVNDRGEVTYSDCYLYDPTDPPKRLDGTVAEWWYTHLVDETNGWTAESEARLIEIAPIQTETCACCGHVKVVAPRRFAPDPTDSRWERFEKKPLDTTSESR